MKVRIHFTWPNGTQDSLVLSGSLDEVREQAQKEIAQRKATDPWSEVIEE